MAHLNNKKIHTKVKNKTENNTKANFHIKISEWLYFYFETDFLYF